MVLLADIALVLGIYCILNASSPPSLTGGDSGELLAVGCELGTAHPPGYPLYTLMINLWTRIDYLPRIYVKDISLESFSLSVDFDTTLAWKVGNLSCILSSLTCLFIKSIARDLLNISDNSSKPRTSIAPSIVAIIFSLSPIVWEYSNAAEVFAVNNFLCALVLFCTARVCSLLQIFKNKSKQNACPPSVLYVYLYLGALISGLCLANQHASFFLVAVLILSIILICVPHSIIDVHVMYGLSCMFTIGISPYLYLVYSAVNVKRASWGDFSSAQGLLSHVLRSEYGTFQLGTKQGDETSLERLTLSFLHASRECYHALWPLVLIGLLKVALQISWKTHNDYKKQDDKEVKQSGDAKKVKDDKRGKQSKEREIPQSKISASSPSSSRFLVNASLYLVILTAYLFYQIMWHFVLSNLPISVTPMAYAVHARFWMQPLMLITILAAVGIATVEHALSSLITSTSVYTTSGLMFQCIDFSVTICLFSLICSQRWHRLDRSDSGWIMHRYGQELLSSLPGNSLLLAHTDLDLNTARYLRECEGMRPDISHLSFQMMPYPWFTKIQAPLYPNVSFVEPYEGISTDRKSQSNAYFVHTFVTKNLDRFPAVFIDMQSINDVEIGDKGLWHGLTLVPLGSLYRVMRTPPKSIKHHKDSVEKIRKLSTILPFKRDHDHRDDIFESYPPGSWEHAVASVINDAKYQLGVYLLTYAIEAQKSVDVSNILIIMDRYHFSASLLLEVVFDARLPMNVNQQDVVVTTYGNSFPEMIHNYSRSVTPDAKESTLSAFSGVLKDVDKNCALAWSRYVNIVKVARGIKDNLQQTLQQEKDTDNKKMKNKTKKALIKKDLLDFVSSTEGYRSTLKQCVEAIGLFVSKYPEDQDVQVFARELNKFQEELRSW